MSACHRDAADPLDALREGWGSLAPAELSDEPADAVTLAVRAELRRAWAELERPPVPPLPAPLFRRTRPPVRPWWPSAAAALLLVAIGAALWRSGGPPRGPSAPAGEGPRVAALTPDRIELTSGSVRLVLLTKTTTPTPGVEDREEPR